MYEKIDAYIDNIEDPKADLIEILIMAQEALGRLDDDHISHLSEVCGVSFEEIEETIEFFPFLIGGTPEIQVCTGLSCSLRGAREISRILQEEGLQVTETPCMGLCSSSPNIKTGDIHYDRITPEKLQGIIEELK